MIILNIYTLSLIDFDSSKPVIIEKKKEVIDKIKVDIKGEVKNGGLYEVENGSRVSDLIAKAGGLTNNADTSIINLSKKLKDEMVIIVYSKSEVSDFKKENNTPECNCPEVNDACVDEDDLLDNLLEEANKEEDTDMKSFKDNKNSKEYKTNGKISINNADIQLLQTLDGIGESKARAIVTYREKNGKFKDINDLLNVSGIGESVFEKIKDKITL